MRSVVLLLLGVQLAYAGTHSLKYLYTSVTGDPDLPEFTAVGLVDGVQFMYFDSNAKKAVPKREWIRQNVGEDYWERKTQNCIGDHQNIQILRQWFNLSQGVHTVQQMLGCEWDDQTGATEGFESFGYDGEDFLSLDLKEMRYISPVQQGSITVEKLNKDKGQIENNRNYFSTVCIEWLQKYVEYGKSSLQRKVSPQVSLLQKSSSSPVACHVTDFYPSGVTISWMKNGEEHHEDVDLGELLPNEDGTFQKTSTIRVSPEEWKNNKFSCVVQHQGETKTVDKRDSLPIMPIVGVLVAVVLLIAIGVIVFVVYKKKQGFKPVSGSDDGSNSSARPQA
ncbi:HLA class I histocompatibility antigen, alpha chain E-like isoform X4 [Siphateles boraxobius]|uniref:HLA class I histocompatibility antigen, alpha chain E-like isoform X4 n=2 Tax=Siphateles boraxobius TaxID=180520 RepID=UPI00406485E8